MNTFPRISREWKEGAFSYVDLMLTWGRSYRRESFRYYSWYDNQKGLPIKSKTISDSLEDEYQKLVNPKKYYREQKLKRILNV